MSFRVFAVQPSGAIERIGTFELRSDAERALTSPGFHIVDDSNDLVLTHKRTDDRVARVISRAIESGKHPAFGHEFKPAQRLPTQRKRGREPEQVEVNGVTRTREGWATVLDLDVSTIAQSARRNGVSFGDDVAHRLGLKRIKEAAERARTERANAATKIEEPVAVPSSPAEEREEEGDALVREVVREVEEAFAPAPVEEPAPIPAQESEQRPEPPRPALAPITPMDRATWFTAREVRILSAVLEHGGVEQLLNNAELGKRVREHAEHINTRTGARG